MSLFWGLVPSMFKGWLISCLRFLHWLWLSSWIFFVFRKRISPFIPFLRLSWLRLPQDGILFVLHLHTTKLNAVTLVLRSSVGGLCRCWNKPQASTLLGGWLFVVIGPTLPLLSWPTCICTLVINVAAAHLAASILESCLTRGNDSILIGDWNLTPREEPIFSSVLSGAVHLGDDILGPDVEISTRHGGRHIDYCLHTVNFAPFHRGQETGDHDLVFFGFQIGRLEPCFRKNPFAKLQLQEAVSEEEWIRLFDGNSFFPSFAWWFGWGLVCLI